MSIVFTVGTVVPSSWLNDVNTLTYTTKTGTGNLVYSTSPTLVTPVLGAATATNINKVILTAPATTATLTLADNSSLITSGAYTSTFTITGTTGVTFPTSGTLAITTQATDTFGAPTDVTTNNVSITAHGFTPKAPNDTAKWFRGDATWATIPAGGTVTTASVVSANGFAGTVANPTTTPAITISTSVTGLLKGNGTSVAAAVNSDLPSMSATVGGAVPTPPNNTTTFLRGDGTFAAPAGGVSVINGYINGYTLSNDGSTPNTVLDIAVGYAADSTNAVMITGTAFTKSISGSWTAGTGNNGMGSGLTVAASTWYHVYAIINNGSYDVYFDTSATAANKPASTTAFRYIGSFLTDGSVHILAFTQYGQRFVWAASVLDLNSGVATTRTLVTVTTPLGFVTEPIFFLDQSNTGTANYSAYIFGGNDTAAICQLSSTGTASRDSACQCRAYTTTSSQVGYRVTGGTGVNNLTINTNGYFNPHVAPVF